MTDNSYHPSQKEIHDLKGLSVGEILRRARTHYGLSLADVTGVLRIQVTSLEALEADDVTKLPGRVYAIGYIRSYAEYLGLDGDQVVSLFKEQIGQSITRPEYNFPAAVSESKRPDLTIFVLSLIGLVVVFASYHMLKPKDDMADIAVTEQASTLEASSEERTAANVTAAEPLTNSLNIPSPDKPLNAKSKSWPPAVEDVMPEMLSTATADNAPIGSDVVDSGEAVAAQPSNPSDTTSPPEAIEKTVESLKVSSEPITGALNKQAIRIVAKDSTWLQIKDPEGTVVFTGILKQGRTIDIPANAIGWKMDTGNAGGLEVYIGDDKLPPLGGNGIVVRRIPLLAEALRARGN